ncbi:hypothetical protein ACFWXM_29815, partial [Achromobacter xylosoxidans]
MLAFVSRRLLATIPLLVFVAGVVFWKFRFIPPDPGKKMAGDRNLKILVFLKNVKKIEINYVGRPLQKNSAGGGGRGGGG